MAKVMLLCFSGRSSRRLSSPVPAQCRPGPAPLEDSTESEKPWDGAERSDIAWNPGFQANTAPVPVREWEGPTRQARELECSGSSGTLVVHCKYRTHP